METLQEKLSRLSQERQETKEQEEQKALEKELEPIRNRIHELENDKYNLEVIKGSLELKSSDATGKGMKEYFSEAEETLNNKSAILDKLIEENKEVLAQLGIETREQLVENDEFANYPEVTSYIEAKEQRDSAQLSNAVLEKKLADLGIVIDADKLSYDDAEKLLADKIESIDNELLEHKLKTPEGREEAIEIVAEKLRKTLPSAEFSREGHSPYFAFTMRTPGDPKVRIIDGKAQFRDWNNGYFIPEGSDAIERVYGKDIAEAGLKKAYEQKVDQAFEKYDQENENSAEWLKVMESASSEKRQRAEKALQDFENQSQKFLAEATEIVDSKHDSFPDFKRGDAISVIRKMAKLSQYDDRTEQVSRAFYLDNYSKFPPKFDWEKLKEKIEKRSEINNSFLEHIKNLKTDEEFKKFFDWVDGDKAENAGIEFYHSQYLHESEFGQGYQEIDAYFKAPKIDHDKLESLTRKYKTNHEFIDHMKEVSAKVDAMKEQVKGAIDSAIDVRLKQKELRAEIGKHDLGVDISRVDEKISDIERSKQNAQSILKDLARFEMSLPQEKLILRGSNIIIPSVHDKWETLLGQRTQEEKNLQDLKESIQEHARNKPKLLGKAKWEADLTELKNQEQKLEQSIRDLYKDTRDEYDKIVVKVPIGNFSYLVEGLGETEGMPSEIFDGLKGELNEVIDRKVPESVIHLNREYKELLKKLT